MDVSEQEKIDQAMIDLDGTETKSRLGANSILAVSLACAKANANAMGVRYSARLTSLIIFNCQYQ